jgi:crotonobetainyl-CoA:carnitine CoA-transferase CaiB-like acyl-CoA transferase
MSGVYDGLTVIELADRRNQWAGKLLADGGARVIQVEPPGGGPGRWCGPFVGDAVDPDRCLDYWWYNTGKQSVALDIGRQPAQDLLRQLLARADIFLESTPPGTLRPYGLDHASLSGHGALIYASLTDFGQDGPWRDYQMNDAAHLALGGHMASSGYSDPSLTPIGGQGHQAWHMGCVFALHGITLALFDRMTSGQGQYIDVSIHDACAIGTESAVPEWLYNGATLYRQTGMHAAARRQPDLELPTADGMYVIAVNQTFGDQGWAKLIEWMEEKGVAGDLTDPKYRDEGVRMADYRQGTAVREGIRRLIAATKGEEVFARAQAYGISWGLVRAPEENYDVPHYRERDFWRAVEHPEVGRAVSYPRGPFMSEPLGIAPRGRAPHLGEHTRQVLQADLGVPAAQIDALVAAGVIR